MRSWVLATAGVTLTVATAHADPAPRPRIAVVVDLVANLTPERATELSAAMADALERTLQVDAAGGGDVVRRLPPTGVPEDCLADRACVTTLAARLDATELLFLSLVQVGASVQVDATWVDAATGDARARPRIELPTDARAGEVFAAAAERLLPQARPRREVVQAPPSTAPLPRPRRRMTPTTWAVGGVALAAVATGVGLGLSTRATYQRCEREPDRCDDGERDGLRTRAMIADAATVAGLIGGGVALVLYLRSAPDATVRPTISPSGSGAVAGVRVDF